jgi:protein MAK16
MKTIERSFSPAKMWEKVKLSSDYAVALQQLDEHLQYWPKYLVHKAKQRLTKITQYLVRMRKLKLKPKMKLVGITKKTEKREARREEKAERAAKIESSIESALLERLKKGTYGDIYNFPVEEYNKALDEEERLADEMDLQDEEDGNVEYVEDFSDLDEDELEDCAWRAAMSPRCNRAHAALADDVPGVADFASDLDEDDEDDDDEEGGEEDEASEDDGDSGRETKPPHASKAGKSSAQPKAAPKLPPKKGTVWALSLHLLSCSNLREIFVMHWWQAAELASKSSTRRKRLTRPTPTTINKLSRFRHRMM